MNSYLELKNKRVFTNSEYREVLKPDVMLLKDFPDNEKFNQAKFWSPAEDHSGKIITDCYKMKWHQIGNGRIQLRLTVMIRGNQSFLCEAYVKENEKMEKRKLARLKTYAELIRRGQYTVAEDGRNNMTAQAKAKQHNTIPHGKIFIQRNHDYSNEVKLFTIATQMAKEKLPNIFIVNAIKTALEFEGVADLLELWSEENDNNEKEEIISDIQDMIDTCSQKETSEAIYIKLNDLDAIANNIRAFKDSLYQKVMEQGGISNLAELTGIPQPSLSRFFNSNAMPRRVTVLKIAKALNLDEIKIDILWCR